MKNKFIKSILLVLWIGVIFSFSLQGTSDTTRTSSGFTKKFVSITLKITNSYKSEDQLDKVVEKVHPVMRKVAHYTEFLILGYFTLLLFSEFKFDKLYLCSILFCFSIACLDELIQLFIDGRAGQILDILIDSLGSITYIFTSKIFSRKK
jgi:VanZ family protein